MKKRSPHGAKDIQRGDNDKILKHPTRNGATRCATPKCNDVQRWRNAMKYTLSQAATATGKNKATIQRAIKSGKISASKAPSGAYQIDPSELHRVFPATVQRVAKHSNATMRNGMQHAQESPDINAVQRIANLEKELAVMEARKNGLEAQKQNLTESVDDLRRRLDASEGRITALLGAPEQKRRRWWRWT